MDEVLIKKIRIVTISNSFKSLENPLARQLFPEIIKIKKDGYGPPEYPDWFLPVDTMDLVCLHHVFCIEEGSTLKPIGSFRQMTLEQCDFYKQEMPILTFAKLYGTPDHVAMIEEIIEGHRKNKTQLLYSSGYAVLHEYRKFKGLSRYLFDLVGALTYLDTMELNISETVAGGAIRFKTDKTFGFHGYEGLKHKGEVLPAITRKVGDQVLLIGFKEMSDYVKKAYAELQSVIEARILISADQSSVIPGDMIDALRVA